MFWTRAIAQSIGRESSDSLVGPLIWPLKIQSPVVGAVPFLEAEMDREIVAGAHQPETVLLQFVGQTWHVSGAPRDDEAIGLG